MLYFKSRKLARDFANGSKKVVDLGSTAAEGRRWAVKVLLK